MEEYKENQIDDHQNQWTNGSFDGEQAYQTNDCKVNSSCSLLQRTGINEAFRVDVGIEHEE